MTDNPLWVEKYRPKTVADTILPASLKATFQQFVDQNSIPNITLSGPPGVGKTTIARAMLEQLECDYIVINGSMNGNIDTLRGKIKQFASTVSFQGGYKVVILDEADYLNPQSTQPALRGFIEEFSRNCRFILTCNFKNRIIEPLHSRCSVVDFKISKKSMAKLATQFFKRVTTILESEKIEYDQKVVAEVINKHFPDWRRTLNELQRYASGGKIDTGILSLVSDVRVNDLINHLKDKNYTEVRKWVVSNLDNDPNFVLRRVYDACYDCLSPATIPAAVLIIAKYQYQSAFVADQEVNLLAALTEIMCECKFV